MDDYELFYDAGPADQYASDAGASFDPGSFVFDDSAYTFDPGYYEFDPSQYTSDLSALTPSMEDLCGAAGQAPLPEGQGYWDEENGVYIYDPRGGSSSPNPPDMGFTDKKTGQWVSSQGAIDRIAPTGSFRQAQSGADIMRSAGALPGQAASAARQGVASQQRTQQQQKQKSDLMALLPFLLAMMAASNKQQPSTASIPSLSAQRTRLPYEPPAAGQRNISYFTPTTYKAAGGIAGLNAKEDGHLGDYSDGGRLLKGPGDGVSDDIPATIGGKQPARLADGEFVIPARIVSELGNGSTDAGARKLYAMMKRIEKTRKKGKHIAQDTKADKHLPA